MSEHGRLLLHVAYQWSLCHDDALDAYQRGLEIFFKRVDTVEPATEVAWLKVVIKHEAIAIRRARTGAVDIVEPDLDSVVPDAQRSLEDQVEGGERVSRSAEALRALKPDEAKALLLKAEGLSYAEIGECCGWSYTKVNRAISEGRKRFINAYRAIEAGDQCARFAPILANLARGRASSAELVEVRPHLKHCVACRATVRELHISARQRVRLLFPFAGIGAVELPDGVRSVEEILRDGGHVPIRSEAAAPPRGVEGMPSIEDFVRDGGHIELDVPAATPTPDAVTPHAVDLGGRVGLDLRLGRIKEEAVALLHRSNASDVATGVHIASAGGGGRVATVATLIGFCIGGAGAGALCVATGVVKAPDWILPSQSKPAPKPQAKAEKRRPTRPARLNASTRTTEAVATPTPTPTPRPEASPSKPRRPQTNTRRAPANDPSQGTTPTSHESAPIAEAPPQSVAEFSIEQSASSQQRAPDPPPATGGGEFMP